MKMTILSSLLCTAAFLPVQAQLNKTPDQKIAGVLYAQVQEADVPLRADTFPEDNTTINGASSSSSSPAVDQKRYFVQVKMVVYTDAALIKGLHFGYQDEVSVFLNDKLIYLNQEGYGNRKLSQDPDAGFFDFLFIPLKKGRNELRLEGLQQTGGIGVRSRWADLNGLRVP